ncbi:MAG: PolC-type DNA polymerase III [Oscillospiraceae bacterium]|nr:PolC-type DNA polymerase III [Oscillospiraceae bacterium]
MAQKAAFLEVFPCCADISSMCGGLEEAYLTSVEITKEEGRMLIEAFFPRMPAPAEINLITDKITSFFGLNLVEIKSDYPKQAPAKPAEKSAPAEEKKPWQKREYTGPKPLAADGDVIMGKPIKGEVTPLSDVTLESGSVIVKGKVFATDSREVPKHDAAVLSFCMTDGTGSIHISRFIKNKSPDREAVDKIKDGMYICVSGDVAYNRYDEDMALDARHIQLTSEPPTRKDKAQEKRVELHLHTRFSNLDALTDPAAAIKRAAKWGHPAIAITDHGVAQAFPDAWHAAEKAGIKVIYGLEGYYINDVDERLAITGESSLPFDTEFVAFDIECTGLYADRDRITEIGGVIFSGGEIKDTFNTFVNPEMPIPAEVVRLTGITDEDVANAPHEADALRAFLDFVGDRPLIAHNADFDIGFLTKCAERNNIEFNPVYLDTLVLAQTLLPHLKQHKLDKVSNYLSLPEFNHHRASDDALVVARIMERFIPMLAERGCTSLDTLEKTMQAIRLEGGRQQKAKHIILLVKNKTGLKNLYKMISASYLEHFHRNPIIPKSVILQHREGIIIGSACEAGEFFEAVVRRRSDAELRRIAEFYDYLEIQPICNNMFMIAKGTAENEETLRDYNRKVARIARETGKPLVATGDVHFLDPEDEIFRHILLASKKFEDADKPLPIYFKTTDEMLEEFAYLGEEECYAAVIGNPKMIADQCEDIELLPKGILFPPKIENSEQELTDLVYGKVHDLYGDNPPEIVTERVKTELDTILSHHYDVIYMSAQKLVHNSLEHGYLVGSRGSVGSSIVAFMSGITEVNSLPAHYRCPKCKYSDFESGKGWGCGADMPDKVCPVCGEKLKKDGFDIPFETFLGFPGSAKTPDIDLNFSGEYQANAHKYTETLFGSDHVFRAGTIGTLAEKTAYGYVKKYLEERDIKVTKAEENRLALGCVGVKRTTGQHPGGLVVVPQDMDVTDFCPVQHPADDPTSDIITTHFEYHCMEDNLLKLDELGHDDPTMIKMLEDMTGVDAKEIALDDPETMKIFRSPEPLGLPDDDPIIGKTGSIGIPEFGTGFTRQMLVDTQPDGFDILVRLSGFSHGTDVWLGNAKDLITSGTATVLETVGCRDDIMLYLISKGMDPKMSFKIMEAVRKGKVKKSGFSDNWDGIMREHDVPEWYIESLAKIAYLFPKAHAVAYVMMAFRIAYFKVHHPLAFYCAYFYRRSQKDGFDAEMMTQGVEKVQKKIKEIQNNPAASAKEQDLLTTLESVYEFYKRGFSFAPIDLYESEAIKFKLVGDKQLRAPFVSIAGLGETAAYDLANAKNKGIEFVSVEDVAAACPKVSQTHMETLKALGALGSLPDTSQINLFDMF